MNARPSQSVKEIEASLIPAAVAKTLASRAGQSENLKLENLIDIRELFEELEDELRAERVVMEFYEQVSALVRMKSKTLQDNLSIIRNYPAEKLRYWIEKGLGFDHIDNANWIQNEKESKYTNASALLDDAIRYGGKRGDKPMTVDEMIAFAMGEKEQVYFSFLAIFQRAISKIIAEIPNSWSAEKRTEFQSHLDALKKLIEE